MEEFDVVDTTIQKANFLDFANFEDFPKEVKPLTKSEKREILMREIYHFYKAEHDKRRKENWKRYREWLMQNCIDEKIIGREKNWKKFMKTQKAIKEFTFERLCYLMNYLSVDDLPYFVSTGKEFSHTGANFTAWLSKQLFAKNFSKK